MLSYEFDKNMSYIKKYQAWFVRKQIDVHDAFNKTIKTHTFNYMDAGVITFIHMSNKSGLLKQLSK